MYKSVQKNMMLSEGSIFPIAQKQQDWYKGKMEY